MKRITIFAVLAILITTGVKAQDRYMTRNAKVTFLSDAPLEKIEGKNTQATSVFDAKTGQLEISLLVKAFEFEKSLMQEHFNENYMESDKYPKSVFKGIIQDVNKIDFKKDGIYPVHVKGQLTLHGVTNEVSTEGSLEVKGTKVTGTSSFNITITDYKIEIPSLVKEKVSKVVKIDVVAPYEKM